MREVHPEGWRSDVISAMQIKCLFKCKLIRLLAPLPRACLYLHLLFVGPSWDIGAWNTHVITSEHGPALTVGDGCLHQ